MIYIQKIPDTVRSWCTIMYWLLIYVRLGVVTPNLHQACKPIWAHYCGAAFEIAFAVLNLDHECNCN